MTDLEVSVGAKEAGAAIGVSKSFLLASTCPRHRYQGNGPKGRVRIKFYLSEVRAWWASREMQPPTRRVG